MERILQRGRFNNVTHYLIKWKGYTLEESTWEPIYNLEHCPDAILAFETEIKNREKQSQIATNNAPMEIEKVFQQQSGEHEAGCSKEELVQMERKESSGSVPVQAEASIKGHEGHPNQNNAEEKLISVPEKPTLQEVAPQ